MINTFSQRLRAAREAARLTLEAVGKAVGVTPQAVYRWEHGKAMPGAEKIGQLAIILGVSPTFLLTGTEAVRESNLGTRGHRIVSLYRAEDVASGTMSVEQGRFSTHFSCGPTAFAVSLWDGSNAPEYRAGDQVVIDPSITPEPGDMVFVAIGSPAVPVFGKYATRSHNGDRVRVIQPLNPDWAEHVIGSNDVAEIKGVMTEHARPRRR
jgi:transcriptional regulator with XRE-family HTH domain